MLLIAKTHWARRRPGDPLDLPEKAAHDLIRRGVARPANLKEVVAFGTAAAMQNTLRIVFNALRDGGAMQIKAIL